LHHQHDLLLDWELMHRMNFSLASAPARDYLRRDRGSDCTGVARRDGKRSVGPADKRKRNTSEQNKAGEHAENLLGWVVNWNSANSH
jgi:hypothetical protein